MRYKLIAIFMVAILIGVLSSNVLAVKPEKPVRDFTEWSNGFPSGPHLNLNIHGIKNPDTFTCPTPSPDDGSIFVREYGNSSIYLIQNKMKSPQVENLTILDPCSFSPNDPAEIQLPAKEYQVYIRILGTPGHEKKNEYRNVTLSSNLHWVCNGTDVPDGTDFGNLTNCSLAVGMITPDGVFRMNNTTLERVVPVGKNKGKHRAVNITDMLMWDGVICNDTNDNGVCDPGEDNRSYSGWIFDAAELVVFGWDYQNNGAKMVQVRFYEVGASKFN